MKITPSLLLTVALAVGAGLIEMRVSVARLETAIADVDRRVARIEARIDANLTAER